MLDIFAFIHIKFITLSSTLLIDVANSRGLGKSVYGSMQRSEVQPDQVYALEVIAD